MKLIDILENYGIAKPLSSISYDSKHYFFVGKDGYIKHMTIDGKNNKPEIILANISQLKSEEYVPGHPSKEEMEEIIKHS